MKAAGILLPSLDEFNTYYERGFRFIACGSDAGFVNVGARKMAEDLGQIRSRMNATA